MQNQKTKFKETEIGMIPEDWEVDNLDEITLNITDGTHSTVKDVKDGEYFLLSCKNIKDGKVIFGKKERRIDKETLATLRKRTKLEVNDILLTTVGTIGESAIIRSLNINFEFQRSVGIIKPDTKKIDPSYLYYTIKNPFFVQRVLSSSRGSVQKCLFIGEIKRIQVVYPKNINEQSTIAKILSNLDSKIELLQKQNQTLEKIGQALFKHWFVDFEFPDEKGKSYRSSGGEMVDSELGEIPEGWEVKKIGDKLKTILGGTPSTINKSYWENGTIAWINSGKINEFRIIEPTNYITDEAVENSATKLLPKGTTVLAITGATLGQVSRLEIDACANQSVVGILESELIPSSYVYYWIKNNINNMINGQTGGAQQHINKNNVNNSNILIPSNEMIKEFEKIINSLLEMISLSCFEIQNLSKIRDSLLPKLMSGKIRVPVEVRN
jgi:type I restriction enzyme, S subunit